MNGNQLAILREMKGYEIGDLEPIRLATAYKDSEPVGDEWLEYDGANWIIITECDEIDVEWRPEPWVKSALLAITFERS